MKHNGRGREYTTWIEDVLLRLPACGACIGSHRAHAPARCFVSGPVIVNGFTAIVQALPYAPVMLERKQTPVDILKRLPVRPTERLQSQPAPEQNGDRNGQLDIPVESWEQYKSWCERVRETWRDEPPASPPAA
jgi:hypothetical protein